MAEHAGKAFIQIGARGSKGFAEVGEAFQKVDLGNSAPRRCNRVSPDAVLLGVMTVTDPVSIHLKDFNDRKSRGLQAVVDLQVGAVGHPLGVEGGCAGGGDVTATNGCLRSAEITDEITAEGGWQSFQECADCGVVEYLRLKKGRT